MNRQKFVLKKEFFLLFVVLKKGGGPSSADYLQLIGNPGEKSESLFSFMVDK